MDIEWAKDGHTGELSIVQAQPETVQSGKDLDGEQLTKDEARDEPSKMAALRNPRGLVYLSSPGP